jgi:hypothetical protein
MEVPSWRELSWTVAVLAAIMAVMVWWIWATDQAVKRDVAEAQRLAGVQAQREKEQMLPAPVVRRGPIKVVKGHRMSTWIASGAGDATYNGTYTESGTANGKPKYTNGTYWLYWNGANWILGGDSAPPLGYIGSGADLPANAWSANDAAAPAPTVAEYTDSGDYDWDDGPFIPDMPLAPGRVTLDGNPYVIFPVDAVSAHPMAHGFRLYNLNSGAWSSLATVSSIFGSSADTFNSAGTFDVGDGLHVWVCSGIWKDGAVPKVTFKQYAIVPPATPTVSDTDTLTLTADDCSNFVQVSTGVFRFILIDGSDVSLCEYTAGSGTYSTLVTYSSGTAFPTSYTATALLTVSDPQPGRTDHALFSRGGTLYWMRRCETGDPVTSRLVAAYELTETTCTLLGDTLTDSSAHTLATPPDDYQTQTWATFASVTWGDLGRHYDHDTRLTWTPGDDGVEGTPLSVAGVTRRWYIDDDLVLMAGWSDAGTYENKAFVYRTPTVRLAAAGEVVLEGEGELHITPPVYFEEAGLVVLEGDATLQVLYPVRFVAAGQISLEGEGRLKGAIHLSGEGEISLEGEAMLLIYEEPPSVVQGYSGGQIEYKAAAAGDTRSWEWEHARPDGYDTRANRSFGALVGGVKTRTSPDHERALDPRNVLSDDVIYCSWFTG